MSFQIAQRTQTYENCPIWMKTETRRYDSRNCWQNMRGFMTITSVNPGHLLLYRFVRQEKIRSPQLANITLPTSKAGFLHNQSQPIAIRQIVNRKINLLTRSAT